MANEGLSGQVVELVCLGVDAIVCAVAWKYFLSIRKAAEGLKQAPHLDVGIVKEILSDCGHNVPYAVVKGRVSAAGTPLRSQGNSDVTGVVQRLIVKEHKIRWNWSTRWWVEDQPTVSDATNYVPFILRGDKNGVINVQKPLDALDVSLVTLSDKFIPAQQNFGESVLGFFRGERIRGYQEVEKMLREGTEVTGIGKLTVDSWGNVQLSPPEHPLRYYLSTESVSTILNDLHSSKNLLKGAIALCGVVACTVLSRLAWKLYQGYKKNEALRRRRRDLQNIRQHYHSPRNNDEGPPAPACVICLTNPREVLILDCGHVCACASCAENLSSLCPICRGPIRQFLPAFIS